VHRQYDTGVDLKKLAAERPAERYKFYFSLDVSDPEKEVFAQTFSRHLLALCKQQGISLTSKSFDHDYDSWNLYTWDPQKLAPVIQMLYPQYKDTGIFRTTKHWMQGSLQGVSPEHVGWVEEPMTTKDRSGMSHSSRMGKLGAALDAGNSYIDACALAGVNAAEPWKLLREEKR
jgi:hypothetical protein